MALKDLLEVSSAKKKIGLSEERINAIKPIIRNYVSYWREYPDMFIDFMQTGWKPDAEPKLKFYFY